jgi:hypothetical protein
MDIPAFACNAGAFSPATGKKSLLELQQELVSCKLFKDCKLQPRVGHVICATFAGMICRTKKERTCEAAPKSHSAFGEAALAME